MAKCKTKTIFRRESQVPRKVQLVFLYISYISFLLYADSLETLIVGTNEDLLKKQGELESLIEDVHRKVCTCVDDSTDEDKG